MVQRTQGIVLIVVLSEIYCKPLEQQILGVHKTLQLVGHIFVFTPVSTKASSPNKCWIEGLLAKPLLDSGTQLVSKKVLSLIPCKLCV